MVDEEDLESPKPSKVRIAIAFTALLAISYIASTLAATITINTNNRVEFGQGVYNLKACDDFINISLGATSTDGSGISKVNRIIINGFDSAKCKNRNFTIKIFKNDSISPENLFDIASPNKANQVRLSVDNSAVVTLINTSGVNVGSGDAYHNISYSAGVYTITFVSPLLPVPDVGRTTIESANN